MRYAYFDSDGICLLATSQPLASHDYTFEGEIPDEGKLASYYCDASGDIHVGETTEDFLGDISANLPLNVGEEYTFTIPDSCVLEIDGTRYKGSAKITFNQPTTLFFSLKGAKNGDLVVPCFTYAENRAAVYPTVEAQLDMIYHLGLDGWKAEITRIKNLYPKPS
jgi:hypothetical protein